MFKVNSAVPALIVACLSQSALASTYKCSVQTVAEGNQGQSQTLAQVAVDLGDKADHMIFVEGETAFTAAASEAGLTLKVFKPAKKEITGIAQTESEKWISLIAGSPTRIYTCSK